jgi:hypothetical protein
MMFYAQLSDNGKSIGEVFREISAVEVRHVAFLVLAHGSFYPFEGFDAAQFASQRTCIGTLILVKYGRTAFRTNGQYCE